jgi:hypothetical protein
LVGEGSGDVNGDGVVFLSDFGPLLNCVLFGDHSDVASLCNAEINGLCNPEWPCEPTLGDVMRMVEYIWCHDVFEGFVDCELATQTAPIGELYTYPSYRYLPDSPGPDVPVIYDIFLKNDGTNQRQLYGYSVPLEFRLVGGGTGGDIDSLVAYYRYQGPDDAWISGSSFLRHDPNGIFIFAVPDPQRTSQPLGPGAQIRLVGVAVYYTLGSDADDQPYVEVDFYSDPDYPGHVPVISLNGLLKGVSTDSLPSVETQFMLTVGCHCPYQSDFDEDGFLTSLDLNGMIDVLFAGDPDIQDPYCPGPRADFDCDGFSTSLDLGYLIDHLYAGDDGPCNPCDP